MDAALCRGVSTTISSQKTSLDRYRTSLEGLEPLASHVERDLALRWRAGDPLAGKRLIEASLPFVIRIAREYRRWGAPLEDLIQQGNLGLLKAAQKFDPEKQCRLITYAVYWIRAEIRDYVVRTYRIVRLGTTRTERRAMRAFRRSGAENVSDLAAESGMPEARAQMLLPLLKQGDMSLDATYTDRGPAVDRLGDGGETPEDLLLTRDTKSGVREALELALVDLNPRERRIVEARMIAEDPQTLEALGREMGVSKERVRQIEERAREKLRERLSAFAPER
jgi:RNA polymerase sigma-32 factor